MFLKISRFSTFTLGVLVTAVSIGAVNYASASGNATIKACANKTTGAMRYIAKGACKKTESSLKWNQLGPQGLQGATGVAGTNGQNFHVLDANGRDLGPMLGIDSNGRRVSILHNDGIFLLHDFEGAVGTTFYMSSTYFSDSSCITSLVELSETSQVSSPQARVSGWDAGEVNRLYGRLSGQPFLKSNKTIYAKVPTGTGQNITYPCKASTDPAFITWWNTEDANYNPYFSEWTPVTPPAYSAPFTVVSK